MPKTTVNKENKKKKDGKLTKKKGGDGVAKDELSLLKPKFNEDINVYIEKLWTANKEIYEILKKSGSLEKARDAMFDYLNNTERKVFALDNDSHVLEKAAVRDSIRIFKSIIGPINEKKAEFSSLDALRKLARGVEDKTTKRIKPGFIYEFISLFKAVSGQSRIYGSEGVKSDENPEFLGLEGREAASSRSKVLDNIGASIRKYFKRFPSGLDEEIQEWRKVTKERIKDYFDASEEDWNDYIWQVKNVIKDDKTVLDLIELPPDKAEAVKKAVKYKIPFGITPYYLSLMDYKYSIKYDHAVRAQVIPPKDYVDQMVEHKKDLSEAFDFMGEHDTSPIDLITRRYPMISILKPFNTCAQICVYCQRNWEIERVLDPKAMSSRKKVDEALEWLDEHPSIGDVLITGGDPMIMKNSQIERMLEHLNKKDHVYRIRIGTRTPVVLPQRWTDETIEMLSRYHNPPEKEIAIVTHFEHSYEITPDTMEAVQKIRKAGVSVYNQQVYTIENSRRFETVKLRRDLKSIGIDPYYNFNMKGKQETKRLMVPIARILQERKEEARLLPGLDRTDEPVFNVPKMGKNHLRAMQDHRLVMIKPDGARVYEFHPWEKNIAAAPPYYYTDLPIYDYLEELAALGEDINEYRNIWYYY